MDEFKKFRAGYVEASRGQGPGYLLTEHPDASNPAKFNSRAFLSTLSTGDYQRDQRQASFVTEAKNAWEQYGTLLTINR